MKDLSTYLTEALKKVGEYRDVRMKGRDDADIMQILDRSFKEGINNTAFESWIKKDIEECFGLKFDHDKQIDKIYLNLNPVSGVAGKVIVKGSAQTRDQWSWSSALTKELADWFDTFGYRDSDGQEVELRDGVIGWVITYDAVPGTEEPKSGRAHLQLKLNKETEKLVDKYNKRIGQSVSDYYNSKKPGEYTGD